jgi:hypothetical protein
MASPSSSDIDRVEFKSGTVQWGVGCTRYRNFHFFCTSRQSPGSVIKGLDRQIESCKIQRYEQ